MLEQVAPRGARVRAHANPHLLERPKEALKHLSRDGGRFRYTTARNPELAEHLDLTICAARCPSFAALQAFIQAIPS